MQTADSSPEERHEETEYGVDTLELPDGHSLLLFPLEVVKDALLDCLRRMQALPDGQHVDYFDLVVVETSPLSVSFEFGTRTDTDKEEGTSRWLQQGDIRGLFSNVLDYYRVVLSRQEAYQLVLPSSFRVWDPDRLFELWASVRDSAEDDLFAWAMEQVCALDAVELTEGEWMNGFSLNSYAPVVQCCVVSSM